MPTLLELRGIQGSGKSTHAKELVDSGWVRVNRDTFREMLFNNKWSPSREDLVREIETETARKALLKGHNVVIDDMNLSKDAQNQWTSFVMMAKKQNSLISIKHEIREFNTPLDTCILRDSSRVKPIGRAIIENTALRYGLIPELNPEFGAIRDVVFCDVDGTIADLTHRRKFVSVEQEVELSQGQTVEKKKDWESFFAGIEQDEPIWPVINWINALYDSKQFWIFLVSGRNTNMQFGTHRWLDKYGVKFHRLFMRGSNDRRPDYEIKNGIVRFVPFKYIAFAVDDRPQVIELVWRANKVHVFPVNTWSDWPKTEHEAIKNLKESSWSPSLRKASHLGLSSGTSLFCEQYPSP